MKIYFSDFFDVSEESIESYGAFNPSLINDMPLFIDPFLLFNSEKKQYQDLHSDMIQYLAFLREVSKDDGINKGLLKSWFMFPEVKQNWFGYSTVGNGGSGLGAKFAKALNENLHTVFTNFGSEEITTSSHLEKLCLIRDGVGRDNISDFTTNLIKSFLLEYTQEFARKNINKDFRQVHLVEKVYFNYQTRTWVNKEFDLPTIDGDFVLLTPKDILTKDETWINKADMVANFNGIANAIPNDQLRAQLNDYLARNLPVEPNKKDYDKAIISTILKYPEYIDYFIKFKEDSGEEAKDISKLKVKETEVMFIERVKSLAEKLKETEFYENNPDTFDETLQRINFMKQVIENNDGYKIFYIKGQPVKRESDLQLLFRLTWFASVSDVNAEVNNGRGPVDYKISRGNRDKTLVEFKLASNSKLKQNLKNQVQVYETANQTKKSIKVILYFNDTELAKLIKVFKELELTEGDTLVTIDARPNKDSASNVK
ncbi:hypothetical protein [Vibrio parahaemolyticus]|uniref:hypothetical protein n=1 Tax=Vibrio parahaemolyticus TaxID=670 RepID=UPI0005F26286|nr:hypothetical protein [Vibrio parahaemolyticus]MDX1258057.1 hypothetical protein [Vibrio parahaemolyticus]